MNILRLHPLARPCPFLPPVYVAWPKRNALLKPGAPLIVTGLGVDPSGVERVDILIDRHILGQATLGGVSQVPPAPAALAYDPDYPRLRFSFSAPSAALSSGPHSLAARMTAHDGAVATAEPRTIYVGG